MVIGTLRDNYKVSHILVFPDIVRFLIATLASLQYSIMILKVLSSEMDPVEIRLIR